MNFRYAQASPITINNAGFENPLQSDGGYTDNLTVPDWDIYSAGMQKNFWYGVWNPVTADFPLGVPQGSNIGYIETDRRETGIVGFEQTLGTTLTQNTTYQLQVDIGNPLWGDKKSYKGFPGYRIELLAGGELLGFDENTL